MRKVIAIIGSLGLIGLVAFLNFHIPTDTSNYDDTKIYKWQEQIKQLDPATQDDVFKSHHDYLASSNADTGNYNGSIRKSETDLTNRLWIKAKASSKTFSILTYPFPVVQNAYLPDTSQKKPFLYLKLSDDDIKTLETAIPTLSSINVLVQDNQLKKFNTVDKIDKELDRIKEERDKAQDAAKNEIDSALKELSDNVFMLNWSGAWDALSKGNKSFKDWNDKYKSLFTKSGKEFSGDEKDMAGYIRALNAKRAILVANKEATKSLKSQSSEYNAIKRLLNKDYVEAAKEGDELFPIFDTYDFVNRASQNIPPASLGASKDDWKNALSKVTGAAIDLDKHRCIIIRSGKFIAVYSNVKSWWVYKGNEGKYSTRFDAPPKDSTDKPTQNDVLGYANSTTKVLLFKYKGKDSKFGVKEILNGGPVSMHKAFGCK